MVGVYTYGGCYAHMVGVYIWWVCVCTYGGCVHMVGVYTDGGCVRMVGGYLFAALCMLDMSLKLLMWCK